MMLAVAVGVGVAAAAWLHERRADRDEHRRELYQALYQEESDAALYFSPPSPEARPITRCDSADARVAAAVQRAAQAEAESCRLAQEMDAVATAHFAIEQCALCADRMRDHALVPCGHVACGVCGQRCVDAGVCDLCNENVDGVIALRLQ